MSDNHDIALLESEFANLDAGTWLYEGRRFDPGRDKAFGHYGFVYLNYFPQLDKFYIGRKSFFNGDWPDYAGSGVEATAYKKVLGIGDVKRTIVQLCETEGDAVVAESQLITKYDAVKSDRFMNRVNVSVPDDPEMLAEYVKQINNRDADKAEMNMLLRLMHHTHNNAGAIDELDFLEAWERLDAEATAEVRAMDFGTGISAMYESERAQNSLFIRKMAAEFLGEGD